MHLCNFVHSVCVCADTFKCLEGSMSRVYLKADPSLVTMPTHFTERHRVYLNEFIFKLLFAAAFSVSCVHTLHSCGTEAFSIAKCDLGRK